MKYQLYNDQSISVDDIRTAFRTYNRVLFVLPTAAGKTIIFCHIAEKAAARGNRVIIGVHRRELLHQCSAHLWELGVEHGLIGAGKSMSMLPVQVASVDTLVRRLDRIPPQDLFISDEAHHDPCASRRKIYTALLERNPDMRILGVTATPERLDGKGLGVQAGGFYETIIQGPYIDELIALDRLPPFVYFWPPQNTDVSNVHMLGGDFKKDELVEVVDKRAIIGDAVAHYAKHTHGEPFIAFGVTVKHAQHIAEIFNGAGIQTASIDGSMPTTQRDSLIKSHKDGRLTGLTSCDLISEGTDIPRVSVSILMRHTKSLTIFLQQAGRACRKYPGKRNTYIHDHAGLIHEFGPPWLRRDWSLDGKAKDRKPLDGENGLGGLTRCRRCFVLYPCYLKACRECGYVNESQGRSITQVAGELQRLEMEQQREEEVQKLREKWDRKRQIRSAKTLEDLIEVAKILGYNVRWADFVWKARQEKKQLRELA